MMTRRLAPLLATLLLAAALLPGVSADDVRAPAWLRLLEQPAESRRPCLGLVPLGAWWYGDGLFGPDPEDRPDGGEGGHAASEAWSPEWDVEWLLSWGHGGDVAAGLLRRVAVSAEVRTPAGRVHRARLVAVPGCRGELERTRVLRVVPDYSTEIACDNSGGLRPSALGDPEMVSLRDGLVLDVRPFALGKDRVALEVVFQAGRFDPHVERLDTGARFLGEVDLPRYRGVLLAASGTTAAGSPLDLSVQGGDGERYVVRLTPWILDVPEPEDRARVHPVDARFLLAPSTEVGFCRVHDPFANPPAHVAPDASWGPSPLDRSVLWEHIDHSLPRAEMRLLPHGDVWIVGDEGAVADVGRTFERWAARAARTVRVEITARAGDEVIGRVDVPVLTGRTGFFRLGVDQAVLRDADVEVG